MWDNFEYWENIHEKRVRDAVKFRSVTMALWIRHNWKIPSSDLLQSMWRPKEEVPNCVNLLANIFGPENVRIWSQCVWAHWCHTFTLAFLEKTLDDNPAMSVINLIDCKYEGATEVYAFAPSMYNENSTAGNILVFEDLNVI